MLSICCCWPIHHGISTLLPPCALFLCLELVLSWSMSSIGVLSDWLKIFFHLSNCYRHLHAFTRSSLIYQNTLDSQSAKHASACICWCCQVGDENTDRGRIVYFWPNGCKICTQTWQPVLVNGVFGNSITITSCHCHCTIILLRSLLLSLLWDTTITGS